MTRLARIVCLVATTACGTSGDGKPAEKKAPPAPAAKTDAAGDPKKPAEQPAPPRSPPTPLVGCDPAGKPTREQAAAAHAKTGREYTGNLLLPTGLEGLHKLLQFGGTADAPSYDLGYVWRCQLHAPGDVVPVILGDLGWKEADPAGRAALATKVDQGVLAEVVTEKPAQWDDAHPFTAPETKSLPDGGVERTRWIAQFIHIWGGRIPAYVRERVTFTGAGELGATETLDDFKLQ